MPRQSDVRHPVSVVTPAWSDDEVRQRLAAAGRSAERIFPVAVSPTDPGVEATRRQAARRRGGGAVLAVGAIAIVALAVLVPGVRRSVLSGLGGSWLLLLIGLVLQYRYRPRIGPIRAGSQAESFVVALLEPTATLAGVVARWLVWTAGVDAAVVTQEERWSIRGPTTELKVRWIAEDGQISSASPAGHRWRPLLKLHFADGSSVVVDLPPTTRTAVLTDWPARG